MIGTDALALTARHKVPCVWTIIFARPRSLETQKNRFGKSSIFRSPKRTIIALCARLPRINEPNGNVYPCCIKTKMALGSLLNEKLDDILHRCSGNPVYEAISMGHPQRMGIQSGWSVEKFLEKSKIVLPSGRVYQNLCVGCDRFHEEVLMHNNALVSIAK